MAGPNEKSFSLALEVAKKARSKTAFGPDEVRKARLHNILFGLGDDLGDEAGMELADTEMVEEEAPEASETRKDRLVRILSENSQIPIKKTDV